MHENTSPRPRWIVVPRVKEETLDSTDDLISINCFRVNIVHFIVIKYPLFIHYGVDLVPNNAGKQYLPHWEALGIILYPM